MITIGLLFHAARNDNLGVGALTVSNLAILRAAARAHGVVARFLVFDGPGPRPPCVMGEDVEVLALRPLRRPGEVFAALGRCDMVVDIGGGDSLTDIYGPKRFALMHQQKFMAHLRGLPLVLAPQTFGPFGRPLLRRIAAASIRRAALVCTRDRLSTAALAEMGLGHGVIEASDVALRLPFDPPPPRVPRGRPRVGLNVSGLLASGGYTRANMFGLRMDYRGLMERLAAAFLAHPDRCEVHLVPHVIGWERGGVEDDVQASLDLAARVPGLVVAPAFATPSEAKSYIAGLDFFVGARMHACIAAFSSGVPVVPMAYSRKFAGLFGSLGYDRTVDCTAEDEGAILAKVTEAYDTRAVLAAEARPALVEGLRRLGLYERAVGEVMERVAAGRK